MGGASIKILLAGQHPPGLVDFTHRLERLGYSVELVREVSTPGEAELVLFFSEPDLDIIRTANSNRKQTGNWITLIGMLGPSQPAEPLLKAGCDMVLPMDITDSHLKAQLDACTRACREIRGPLDDHEDYFRIFQSIRHPILVLSPEQTILAANREAERLAGMSASEIEGHTCYKLFHGTDSPPRGCPLVNLLESENSDPVDMIMETLHKSHMVSVTPIRDKTGKLERIIHIGTDVTERLKAERELARREKDYRLLADTTDDLIFVYASDGSVTYLNRAGLDFFGISEDQVKGTSISDYIDPKYHELLISKIQEKISDSKMSSAFDLEAWDRLGQMITLEAKTAPIIQHGELKGILLTARNNSERRKMQLQLLQAQKMEAVGRLAAGVAHDFNNLLTAILGNCDLLQVGIEMGEDPREGLDEIRSASEKASALTQRLLAFSRKQPSMVRVIDLGAAVRDMEKMLRRMIGEDIELAVTAPAEPLNIKTDYGHFEQVILNLAINARDAMPNGGKLSFRLRTVDLDDESAQAHPGIKAGRFHELAVSDTGSGMTEEVRKKVFEPFFTTKKEGRGTGLGLSTVRDILLEAGGQVLVYSEPGKGTTFRLFWPPTDQPADHTIDVLSQPPHGKHETILLLEDESIVRGMVKTALERWGYKVIEAIDGKQAINKAMAQDGPIHLLLADVILPGDMNGPAVAKQLRKSHAGIKTIHMSGYSGDIIFDKEIEISPNLLQKPFSLNELLSTVRRVLDS